MKYLIWILGIYTSYCLILFLLQRSMIFPVHMIRKAEFPPKGLPGVERFWLDFQFGKTECWFVLGEGKNRKKPVMILAHGNAELIDDLYQLVEGFRKMGVSLLLVEYPGYGRSEGKPSQKTITETFIKAYDTVIQRKDIDPKKVIVMGRSLGGGAVCALAGKRDTSAIILQSTFTSAVSFAKNYLVPPVLMRDPFDNSDVIKDYRKPVLVMHGEYDDMISVSHGKGLHRQAQNGKLIIYPCGHNDFPHDLHRFYLDIESFLKDNRIL